MGGYHKTYSADRYLTYSVSTNDIVVFENTTLNFRKNTGVYASQVHETYVLLNEESENEVKEQIV